MSFDIVQWQNAMRHQVSQFAKDPHSVLAHAGLTSIYGFLLGSTMLPVIAAYAVDPKSTLTTLLGVVGDIGGNLVANLAQQKYDQGSAIAITAAEVKEAEYAPAYQAIAQKIDVISLAEQALQEAGHAVILEQLRKEVRQQGKAYLLAKSINVEQSGGVNFGFSNTIGAIGDIMQGDKVIGDKYVSGRDTSISINYAPTSSTPRTKLPKSKQTQKHMATNSPVDPSDIRYERQYLEKLLDRKKRRLYALERQAASAGSNIPPEVQKEIDGLKAEIKQLRLLLNNTAS